MFISVALSVTVTGRKLRDAPGKSLCQVSYCNRLNLRHSERHGSRYSYAASTKNGGVDQTILFENYRGIFLV